nr:hypothetical protein Iba_chr10eCG10050 [Ipomoea batatas]
MKASLMGKSSFDRRLIVQDCSAAISRAIHSTFFGGKIGHRNHESPRLENPASLLFEKPCRSIPREPFRSISEEPCNFNSEKLYQSNSEELCKSDSEEPCKSNYGEPCKPDSGNRASSTPRNRASPTLRTVGVASDGDGVHHRSPVKTPATHSQCRRYWWCVNGGLLVTATSFSSGNVNGHTSHNLSGFSDISCATWNTLRTLLSLETTFRVAQISDEDPEPLRCAFQVVRKLMPLGFPPG